MSRRTQLIVLGVLFVVLLVTAYYTFSGSSSTAEAPKSIAMDERFTPLNVDNPALRMDVLKRFQALEYKGVHRNVFSSTAPPPPAPPQPPQPVNLAPTPPPGPPPLSVDAKYFGYVSDTAGSHRKAFFASSNNEDVFIAGEGDTLMGRFRVIRLTNTSADVEEVSSGRRATLNLEDVGPNG